MKLQKKGAFFALMLAGFVTQVFAQSPEDFEIAQNTDNTLTITRYKGSVKDVVIPATLYGLTVTVIGEEAFGTCGLTRIVWGKGLKTIRPRVFNENQLKTLIIPDGVTVVGGYAFSNNPLVVLGIPPSLTSYDWSDAGPYRNVFNVSSIICVILPENTNDSIMEFLDSSLRNFYISQNKAAGVYIKRGPIWTRGTTEEADQMLKERKVSE